MSTKLTLWIDSRLIKKAKKYAAVHGVSLSELVEDCFALLGENKHIPLPMTRELHGVLKGALVNEDDYKAYLEQKYK